MPTGFGDFDGHRARRIAFRNGVLLRGEGDLPIGRIYSSVTSRAAWRQHEQRDQSSWLHHVPCSEMQFLKGMACYRGWGEIGMVKWFAAVAALWMLGGCDVPRMSASGRLIASCALPADTTATTAGPSGRPVQGGTGPCYDGTDRTDRTDRTDLTDRTD